MKLSVPKVIEECLKRGMYDVVIKHGLIELKTDSKNPELWRMLSVALGEKGHHEEAIRALDSLMELDFNEIDLSNLICAYLAGGHFELANETVVLMEKELSEDSLEYVRENYMVAIDSGNLSIREVPGKILSMLAKDEVWIGREAISA